jgi:hypothetical protein
MHHNSKNVPLISPFDEQNLPKLATNQNNNLQQNNNNLIVNFYSFVLIFDFVIFILLTIFCAHTI